jgi:hypothetical protein
MNGRAKIVRETNSPQYSRIFRAVRGGNRVSVMRIKLRGSLIRTLFEPRHIRRIPGGLASRFGSESEGGLQRLPPLAVAAGAVENGGAPRVQPKGSADLQKIRWSSPSLVNEIAGLVQDGYNRSPWGGVEVGGVLFGIREPTGVRIHAYRSVETEHKSGPSFELSGREVERLGRLLADAKEDASLKGLVPVGWYHSVSNQEFCLTEQDVKLHDDFFQEPWQAAVVFKRSKTEPVVVGAFFRQDNGRMATQPECAYSLGDLRSWRSLVQPREPAVLESSRFTRQHQQPSLPSRPNQVAYAGFPNKLTTRLRYQ